MDQAARDRWRWNRRYRERQILLEPAGVLMERADLLQGGRALDLGCGTGGNALFLADRGYRVDAIDVSDVALRIAQAAARSWGAGSGASGPGTGVVNWIQADARRLPLAGPHYDCIVVFRFLLRSVMPVLLELLRPQGIVFYASYNMRRLNSHPDFNRDYLLDVGELRTWFGSLSTLLWREEGDMSTFIGRK